jgi:hypothetical protein
MSLLSIFILHSNLEIFYNYLVPERKPRSGTVLSFGLKKENNLSEFEFSKQN